MALLDEGYRMRNKDTKSLRFPSWIAITLVLERYPKLKVIRLGH